MPTFTFQPYHSPFANSIAELMLRRGDVAAHHAEQIGAIQGNAAQQQGQAWSHALLGATQGVTGAIEQATDPRRQLEQIQVGQARQLQKGQGAVDTMMRGDQLAPGDTGPRQESYLDANGLFDIGKMTQALGSSGVGHLAPELLKGAEQINDSVLRRKAIDQQVAEHDTLQAGDLAAGALKLSAIGMPLVQAMDFVVQPALANKTIQPAQYAQIRAQIAALPPDRQAQALTSFMDAAAKIAPTKNLGKDVQEVDRYNRVIASNMVPEKAEKATFGLKQPDGSIQNVEGSFLPTANGGKGSYSYLGQDVSDRVVKPAEQSPHSLDEQLLEATTKGDTARAKQITETMRTAAAAKGDPAQIAALNRQMRTIQAQIDQQNRSQNFAEAQAGRKELTDKVEQPYLDAREKADALRGVIAAAQNGNMEAAAVQKLMGVLGVVTMEGVKRINTTELDQVGGAGDLLTRIKGKIGGLVGGQPLPANLQKDLAELSQKLEESARKKYEVSFDRVVQRYGLKDEAKIAAPTTAIGTQRLINGQKAEWDGTGWKAVK